MNKFPILYLLFLMSVSSLAQDTLKAKLPLATDKRAFFAGDVIISPNIGYPQVNAFIIEKAVGAYYKYGSEIPSTTFSVSHHGVYNVKLEYGILEDLGMGFAVSYWDLNVKIQNNYSEEGTQHTDNIDLNLGVLAMGIRANYHLLDEIDSRRIDPYIGGTAGVTKYSKSLEYTTTNPNRIIPEWVPERLYKLKDSWATYFSTTVGIRFYPIKNIGLNFEAGWDKGALLFGGIVLRIHTPPVKAWQD